MLLYTYCDVELHITNLEIRKCYCHTAKISKKQHLHHR